MLEGIIFDLDGTLIDSEPLWRQSQLKVFKEVGLNLTEDECARTKGLKSIEAVNYWYDRHPWKRITPEALNERWHDEVIRLIEQQGTLKEGVVELIALMKEEKLPMAIASASPTRLIETAVSKFDTLDCINHIHSADLEPHGKPHPGIFLSTAKKLGAKPWYCLVFEDSFNGGIAAKAALMKLVLLLDEGQYNETKYDFSDAKLESFHNFDRVMLDNIKSTL
jgi:sugar-phosphatase